MKRTTDSPEETRAVAVCLARSLRAGDVIALTGPMGAGKTAFCGGLAQGLGIAGPVTSPTYTIVNEYQGRLPLFHFDLYRLGGEEELYDLGWEDYLARGGVCVLEWPEVAPEVMEEANIHVSIRPLGENRREITVTGGETLETAGL